MTLDARTILQDYEKTEEMLTACRDTLESLTRHHHQVFEALEALTKPGSQNPPVQARVPVPSCGYKYRGEIVNTRFAVDTYCSIIARLWSDFADRRPAIQAALNSSISFRRGMADSPEKLFPGRDGGWRRGKYRKIADGVFVDINLSNSQKAERLRAAVRACGLTWDHDVVAYGV